MGLSQSHEAEDVQLIFVARKETAGFKVKRELTVTAKSTDTLANVLDNFNQYRGPSTQIRELIDADTEKSVPLATLVTNTPHRLYIN